MKSIITRLIKRINVKFATKAQRRGERLFSRFRISRFVVQNALLIVLFSCNNSGGGCYCDPPTSPVTLANNEVGIRFKEVSFVGDYSHYKSVNSVHIHAEENSTTTNETPIETSRSITNWFTDTNGDYKPTAVIFSDSFFQRTSHQANPATDDFPLKVRTDLNELDGNGNVTNTWISKPDPSTNSIVNLKPGKTSEISIVFDTNSPALGNG